MARLVPPTGRCAPRAQPRPLYAQPRLPRAPSPALPKPRPARIAPRALLLQLQPEPRVAAFPAARWPRDPLSPAPPATLERGSESGKGRRRQGSPGPRGPRLPVQVTKVLCSVSWWPSGHFRCVQVAVFSGGVGSNPTPTIAPFLPSPALCVSRLCEKRLWNGAVGQNPIARAHP